MITVQSIMSIMAAQKNDKDKDKDKDKDDDSAEYYFFYNGCAEGMTDKKIPITDNATHRQSLFS